MDSELQRCGYRFIGTNPLLAHVAGDNAIPATDGITVFVDENPAYQGGLTNLLRG